MTNRNGIRQLIKESTNESTTDSTLTKFDLDDWCNEIFTNNEPMATTMDDTGMYRDLNKQEVLEFQQWARQNYNPGDPISPIWHPVVKAECELINNEDHREIDDVYLNEDE
jgi:hypothetical protein